ncbi:mucin-2-like [Bradysia coprophila]|uniref:mucin-2-like n=1 Tax=Bradysia coprophila TaxID=38358 RepID=UPI00187D843D|nr:mucin-2-like [Bradysia coprophila]
MHLADFCWKLYLWPILADIVKFKGICNDNRVTPFPYITLPPGATFPAATTATGSTLPTFPTLPTGPTAGSSLPTFPTLPPTIPTVPTQQTLPTFPTLTPTIPTIPTQQTLPTFPTLPTIPTVPTQQTLPTFPTLVPTVPTNVPTATPLPTFPTLTPTITLPPTVTLPSFPTIPSVTATVPTFPTIPSVTATLPTFPTIPSVTATLPTFPTIPSVTATLPTFPTIPSVTATLPTFPTIPSVTATVPTFPTIPSVTATLPTFPTIPSVTATLPTFPTIPSVTATLPTFPTIPSVTATNPTFPTIPSVTATLPTFPTIPSVTATLPTIPTIPSVTATIPTFPTLNPGTITPLNCPDGVVLCPVPVGPGQIDPRQTNNSGLGLRQGVLPNGCPCIDARQSAIGILLQAYQLAQNCYSPDNLPGVCINIQNCAFFYRLLQTGETGSLGSLGAYIKKSLCGYDGVDLLVCCPNQISQGVTQSIPQINTPFTFSSLTSGTTVTGNTFPPTSSPTSAPTTSTSQTCGISNFTQTRVVGGGPAKLGQYPWIAALGYTSSSGAIVFNCAGSLITQKHVLTTAHCVNNNLYLARLGEYDLSSTNDGAFPVDMVIDQTFVHEQYVPKIIYSDIAMLKLRDYAPITDQIRPICLPLNEPLRSRDLTGYQPFIAGWGATSYQGPVSSILQEAQIPVVSNSDCERNYRIYFPNQIFDNRVICAGFGGRDSCQGDSGGPLMLPQIISTGSSSYYFVLIGLVSYGYECATDGFPGVYTRVSTFIPWIESKLNL